MLNARFPKLPNGLKGVKSGRTAHSTSLGAEAIDRLLHDDGVPFPSMTLIDERRIRYFTRVMQRIFVAEGLRHEHDVVVAGVGVDGFLDDIPSVSAGLPALNGSKNGAGVPGGLPKPEEQMRIAWRFQSAPKVDNGPSTGARFDFDLTAPMPRALVESKVKCIRCASYEKLGSLLEELLSSPKYTITSDQTAPKTPLRIVIVGLGHALFSDSVNLRRFVLRLKSFVTTASCAALLAVDGSVLANDLDCLVSIADSALRFIPGEGDAPGTLQVVKLPRSYGSALSRPENCDYTFRVSRKTIEVKRVLLGPADDFIPAQYAPLTPQFEKLGVTANEHDF